MEETARMAANMVKRYLGIKTETKQVVLFPETTIAEEAFFEGITVIDFAPVLGKEYTVVMDGVSYNVVGKPFNSIPSEEFSGIDGVYLGSIEAFGIGNGEPFLIEWFRDPAFAGSMGITTSQSMFITNDGDTKDRTLSILGSAETIHPIDQKYLPGVCLPVVELETVVANEVMLSEADVAKLEKVIGFPIVLKMTNQAGEKMATLANYFADGAANAFITTGDASYIFMDEAGTGEWAIITNG